MGLELTERHARRIVDSNTPVLLGYITKNKILFH